MNSRALSRRCRRCHAGTLKVVSDIQESRAVVHCQNPSCDVLYEETFPSLTQGKPRRKPRLPSPRHPDDKS